MIGRTPSPLPNAQLEKKREVSFSQDLEDEDPLESVPVRRMRSNSASSRPSRNP